KIYDEFMENKLDLMGMPVGQYGLRVLPLQPKQREAENHFMITNKNYKSFADFVEKASKDEKRAFWKTVAVMALPLIETKKGARVGYYNMGGDLEAKTGRMVVEIAGGENLGQNGLKKRWFEKPEP